MDNKKIKRENTMKTLQIHQLKIISLHDAQAECICGHWCMMFTGERTKKDIRKEYKKHLKNYNK